MSSPREILERFGGIKEVSETLSKPPSTIRRWSQEGIPPLWHSRLLVLARERDVDLTVDELLATSRK